ncbi:hypothetical protein GCM10008959_11150 [Deinococcus seoulensis]|uniref:Uncharacterized protein n=1 Tax=Deinococcus seoulensis TaxID=1837379 RepID=A0ABQ2RRS4_9DEIO|nr:hypothetical protein [Deinococcus seoulensis]GGR51644.1 hypothetical protein GCM10008959_11150 [Deinococcus seoulensis]
MTAPGSRVRRRRALRRLGITGLWLAALLTLGAWLGVFLALAPARAALNGAAQSLGTLDRQLADAQATLAPLDLLGRPETQEAARTLRTLAEAARRTPLLDVFIPPATLDAGVNLAREWETGLRDRPPLPALAEARRSVSEWLARVQALQRRLTWLGVGLGALVTLLCAWFAVGQVALIRLVAEVRPDRHP